MWVLRERFELSYPEIGRVMNGRDHTTILNGVHKVNKNGAMLTAAKEALRLSYRISVQELRIGHSHTVACSGRHKLSCDPVRE